MDVYRASIAKRLLLMGYAQHEAAAILNVNQGRICEVHRGDRFAQVEVASFGRVAWFMVKGLARRMVGR